MLEFPGNVLDLVEPQKYRKRTDAEWDKFVNEGTV